MYTKDSPTNQKKKVWLVFGSKDSKFSTGKLTKTLIVYDADVEEVYKLVAKFLANQQ